jgi:hypothetical protein
MKGEVARGLASDAASFVEDVKVSAQLDFSCTFVHGGVDHECAIAFYWRSN